IIELNNLDIDMILKLLVAVDELSIEELIDFIQDYLINNNLFELQSYKILNFINTKSMFTKLKKSLLKIICKHSIVLFDYDEFLDLDKDVLKLVIEHDNLDMKENLINQEIALILTKLIDKKKDDESKGFKYKFTLLYNSYLDGWAPQLFHSKCDNQGPTIIVTKILNTTLLIETIKAKKTTYAKLFEDYLKQRGYSVYQFIEASLEVSEKLELFYKTQNFLFFQYIVINLYKERASRIKTLMNYDYIIKDHTIRDMNIFNNFVNNKDEREYVNKKVIETDHFEFYKVVYIDLPLRTTTRCKKKQGRYGKICLNKYLKQLYTLYETSIDTIYLEHIKFNNKIVLYKGCINFKLCQKKCDHKSYDLFFN
ncbi:9513_t:CDS:2, partial [Cetraspora pellucida]